MGWQEQGDGKWSYGLNIENGRLYDNEERQLKATLRAVCHEFETEIRMTGHQSVIFTDIEEGDKEKLIGLIEQHHVPTTENTSTVRRWSMSCVALPTCGLAITESESRFPVGWATKIINIYLKTTVYLAGMGRHNLVKWIHPPIDNELWKGIYQEYSHRQEIISKTHIVNRIKEINTYDKYKIIIEGCRLIAKDRQYYLIEVEELWQGNIV